MTKQQIETLGEKFSFEDFSSDDILAHPNAQQDINERTSLKMWWRKMRFIQSQGFY